MKNYLVILLSMVSLSSQSQEFSAIQSVVIPLDFEPGVLDIPEVSFGIEIPRQEFQLTLVGIPKESTLPKEINMRSIIEGERNKPRREVTVSSFASFKRDDNKKSSVISIEPRVGNIYGDRFRYRGIENISYKDSRTPLYLNPNRRTSIWDY